MSPRPAWRMEERARPTESAAARSCPRCGTPFFSGKVGHLDAMGCGKCGGLWLDNAGTREVLDRYDIDASNLARTMAPKSAVDGSGRSEGSRSIAGRISSKIALAWSGLPPVWARILSAARDER